MIRAFNADKPYARFVARAGRRRRARSPARSTASTALGFIAAGPWDFIGHAEVPETKIDGKVARHLDRDDMVANTINTFLSLTVQCAQCHNHKFDPIAQEDYYRLQAVFAALDRADRPYYTDPAVARKAAELQAPRDARRGRATRLRGGRRQGRRRRAGRLDRKIAAAGKPAVGRGPSSATTAASTSQARRAEWVQVDLGRTAAARPRGALGLPRRLQQHRRRVRLPVRFKVEVSDDPAFRASVALIVDRTGADVPNPGIAPQTFAAPGARAATSASRRRSSPRGRTTTSSPSPSSRSFDADGKNLARRRRRSRPLDSIEAPPRGGRPTSSTATRPGRPRPATSPTLEAERDDLLAQVVGPGPRRGLADAEDELGRVEAELAQAAAGRPRLRRDGPQRRRGAVPRHRARRRQAAADPRPQPRRRAKPRQGGRPGGAERPRRAARRRSTCSADHAEGDRRAALARWLTDSRNPLTWRSIVNRVWQYHFGRGIVATPNDFGRMGQLPTHPELLDWLAVEFRDGGQSLKALHRLIVTSADLPPGLDRRTRRPRRSTRTTPTSGG